MSNASTNVIVGMSGGVDSSVSALLLRDAGYRVSGLFMKNWDEDDGTEYCTAKADLADAQAVCATLGIRLHTANFAAEYWDNVFENFLSEYGAGRTPNPDILCNREIKFKAFLDYATRLGADLIATGHYVRTARHGSQTWLLKGRDAAKDQSYFLCAVKEAQLARTLFPVGDLPKSEVRRIAARHGLATQDKKDSTGICFIGERRFKDFLQTYLPAQPGTIETVDGRPIGRHEGLMYHTLGQRAGLGIGGVRGADEAPWYVVEKDLLRNVLRVAQGNAHPLLLSHGLRASDVDWINTPPPTLPLSASAKTRYRQPDQACRVEQAGGSGWRVSFEVPQRAITPGQHVVLYQGDRCLGGAVIQSFERKEPHES